MLLAPDLTCARADQGQRVAESEGVLWQVERVVGSWMVQGVDEEAWSQIPDFLRSDERPQYNQVRNLSTDRIPMDIATYSERMTFSQFRRPSLPANSASRSFLNIAITAGDFGESVVRAGV